MSKQLFTIRISTEHKQRLAKAAKVQRTTMTALLERAVVQLPVAGNEKTATAGN